MYRTTWCQWIALVLAVGFGLQAQEFRGSITGSVYDPAGAAVAGAKVSAVSVERNTRHESVTNEAGLYVIQSLLPGSYRLTAEVAGFKRFEQSGLSISAADRQSINIRLEIGALTESVTVSAAAGTLQTESASRATTVENRIVDNLPTNGRNLYQLQYTLPGVIKTSRYMGSMELYAFGNINGVSLGGGRSGENETVIDGVSNTRVNRGVAMAPSLNATQEVTIQTNSYDAQYGRVGGGVTSIVIRSGTNQLHGQVFEFLKNDKLNANDWIMNKNLEPRDIMRNNTYGFTVDGPVFIPKVFDGRNKMFFMVSLEKLKETVTSGQIRTLPTDEQLRGDFSKVLNGSGAPVTIYDPLTTRLVDGKYVRTPFTGNLIPSARINSISAKVASYYPKPTSAGEGPARLDNYSNFDPATNGYNAWLGKMDYRFNDKNSVAFRYGETPWINWSKVVWGNNAAEPSGEYPSTRIGRNLGFDYTYLASARLVLNLRGGLARYEGFTGNTFGQDFNPRELGFSESLVGQFTRLRFPRFNVGSYSELGATTVTRYETHDTYSLQPNATLTVGRHFLRMGAEFRRYNSNNIDAGYSTGLYGFTKDWTQADPLRADSTSGDAFASFLLGYPWNGQVDRNIDTSYRNHYYSAYLQDDFKLSSTLTLNLGIRWDYEQPISERYDRMLRGYAFSTPSPIQPQVQGLSVKGGLLYAGAGGASRQAFNPSRMQLQPRIGVAWRFRDKWVMRGGYGLSYLGQSSFGQAVGFARTTPLVASTDGNLTPAATLGNPFPAAIYPNGLLQPIGNSQGLATNLGQSVAAQFLDRALPFSHQFSVGFQRQIGVWLADVSYVGNLTRRLPVSLPQNFISRDQLEAIPVSQRSAYFSERLPNPMAGLLPGSGINGATVPRQQLLYAYPHFSQVTITDVPIGRQSYHSLQMSLTRRFSAGLTTNVNYTWGKTLEAVSVLNSQDISTGSLTSTRLEQRLTEYDIPHKFATTASYDLPFGQGRKFGAGMHPVLNGIAGGWGISGQYILQSGFIMPFPNAANLEARSARLSGDQRAALAQQNGRSYWDVSYDKWFDTTLFPKQAQAPFTLRSFPTRFADVRAQNVNSVELSAFKNFTITERVRLQVRGDFQNAFNHPWFGQQASVDVTNARFGQLNADMNNEPRRVVAVFKVIF